MLRRRELRTAFSILTMCLAACSTGDDDSTVSTNTVGAGGTFPPAMTTGGVGATGVPGGMMPGTGMVGPGVPDPTQGVAGSMPGAPMVTAGSSAEVGAGGMAGAAMPAAGMGGAGGAGGRVGSAGSTPLGDPIKDRKPPCMTKGSQLVLVGDSYIEYTNPLTPRLETKATAAGALESGDHYNNQAIPGSSMAVGLILIPPQWDTALRQSMNDVKFVVMDGGGNDVLLYNMQCLVDGSDMNAQCQQVVADASKVANDLIKKMEQAGVSDVLYFFYPHVPYGGQDLLDYSAADAKKKCEEGSNDHFRCHFVSLVDAFAGHEAQYILSDDIHPTAAGADVQATVIWDYMKEHCIGQTAESGGGCCEP